MAERTVYVIGLDGVPPALLQRGIEADRLPTFERMQADGVEGVTRSTIPPVSMLAWSTFATGRRPGNHGIYNFLLKEAGGYDTTFADATTLRNNAPPFWESLDAVDRSTGIMNVMPGFPVSETSGFHIADHITTPRNATYTHPTGLQRDIEAHTENFVLSPPTGYLPATDSDTLRSYIETVFRTERSRVTAVKHLIEERPCDAMAFVFSAPDVFLHEVGHLLTEDHPRYDGANADVLGDAPLELLELYDGFLDWLLDRTTNEDVVMVLSDHGHGPVHSAVNLNSWLYGAGHLALRGRFLTRLKRLFYNQLYEPIERVLQELDIYHTVKRAVARGDGPGTGIDIAGLLTISASDIDWPATDAFTLAGDGQMYINTTDHAAGRVTSDEYETLREELREALTELEDPATGQAVIDTVYDGEELYPGTYTDTRPDLVAVPNPTYRITFPQTMRTGSVFVRPQKYAGHTSRAQLDGIFLASGAVEVASSVTMQLEDFAPTIHHLLGTAVPKAMDGTVRTDWLEDSRPIERASFDGRIRTNRAVRSVVHALGT